VKPRIGSTLLRFVSVFAVFFLLSQASAMLLRGEAFSISGQSIATALIVAALVTFWRSRQDRRASRMKSS
jgi:hypothetical protein